LSAWVTDHVGISIALQYLLLSAAASYDE